MILALAALGGYYLYTYYQSSELKNQVAEITSDLKDELPEDSWSFIVVGDTEGVNTISEKFAAEVEQSQAEFVVHVGDFVPTGQAEEFTEINKLFKDLTIYPTLGNNDLGSVLDYNETNYKQYIQEELYYSFDHGQAHFIVLDNANRNVGFDSDQLTWLEEDLSKVKTRHASSQQKQYTFIFFHKPFKLPLEEYTGDDDTPLSRKHNKQFREIISQYKIDHIFCGHVHTYFTYNIDETPTTITGGGGAKPQSILGGDASSFYHYLEITISDDEFDIKVNKL